MDEPKSPKTFVATEEEKSNSDLREQIFQTAAYAFPSVIEAYVIDHPSDIFNIAVLFTAAKKRPFAPESFSAMLTFGDGMEREIAFKTHSRSTAEDALKCLLECTSIIAEQRMTKATTTFKSTKGGFVNEKLLVGLKNAMNG